MCLCLQFECMDLDEFLNENDIDEELLKRNLPDGASAPAGPLPTLDSASDLSQLTPSIAAATPPQPFLAESPSGGERAGAGPPEGLLQGPESVSSPASSIDSPPTPDSPPCHGGDDSSE